LSAPAAPRSVCCGLFRRSPPATPFLRRKLPVSTGARAFVTTPSDRNLLLLVLPPSNLPRARHARTSGGRYLRTGRRRHRLVLQETPPVLHENELQLKRFQALPGGEQVPTSRFAFFGHLWLPR
ncbi:unnamed protein product, partial [Scytosiphon promiscuus]